ncbi:protein pinocchio-like isoform X2 [Limulus polyphemus]|nr:protein pinocchio-like isoform X2 [Limulus polyphemus]
MEAQQLCITPSKGLHIRQSKSDPLLQLKTHLICSDFDNHNLEEVALLKNWENLWDKQSAYDHGSDYSLGDIDDMSQVSYENNVLTIENLKSHYNSCFSCGVSWYEDHVSLDCPECGGYALQRPCPECEGQCESKWRRDLASSHKTRQAKWEGECKSKWIHKNNQQLFSDFNHNDGIKILNNFTKNLQTNIYE